MSFYWAAGGTIGLETLDGSLRERVLARDRSLITVVWITGVLKVLAAVLAIALVRPWGRIAPRRVLLGMGWGVGAFLALYGCLDLVIAGLNVSGVTQPVDPTSARWYLVLWGPVWLGGGLLMLGAAWHFTATIREPGVTHQPRDGAATGPRTGPTRPGRRTWR